MTPMHIRKVQPQEIEAVREFLATHGWAHRVGSADEFADLLAHSQRAVVAVADDAIVGFARAITDGRSNGYLSMVVVAPAFRRRGVGRALVQNIIGDDPRITWVLRAGRDGAEAFFSKLGFRVSTVAMERPRIEPE